MADGRATGVSLRPCTIDDQQTAWEWGNTSDIACWINLPHDPAGDWEATSYEEFCDDWKPFYFDGTEPMQGRAFIIEA